MSTLDNVKRQQVYINKAKEKEKQYNIPENMLVGLLKTESGFREDVIQGRTKSSVGAIGIAQFMPNTAKEYGIDPLNVDQAIDGAARYLSKSYKTLGNWDDAIRSYNMGVGGVQAWKSGRKKLPKETAEYLPKVYKNAGLDYKYDTTIQQDQTDFDPTQYNNISKPLNYLPESNVNTTFAGVPDSALPQEKTEEKEEQTDKDIAELQTKTAEQNFLEELYQNNNREIVEQPQPQQQRTQAQPVDYMQMYEQVSNFVDTPLIGGEEQMMQQGGKKTLYVNDKNDPRYRAYQDSLRLYKEGEKDVNKYKEKIKYWHLPKESLWEEKGGYNPYEKIQPIKRFGYISDKKGNIVDKNTGKKIVLSSDGDTQFAFGERGAGLEYKKPTQPVEVKPREKLTPFNYDLELRGIQQNSLEPSSDLTITPQAQIPRYYNITDRVNQNFGGGETKYRWNPNQGELPNISEEIYPDGTPYNERKIEPVYQQGGGYSENELAFLSEIAQQGGIPISSRGLYNYPKQEVIVPTTDGRITMKGIDYDVLGIDEFGNKKVMKPNGEYKFKGKTIREIPLFKK